MTTDVRCRSSAEMESTDFVEMSNGGASPSASARERYKLLSRVAPDRSPMRMRSGSLGETMKLNALSSASASLPIRTVPRVLRDGGVIGANVTDAEIAFASLRDVLLFHRGERPNFIALDALRFQTANVLIVIRLAARAQFHQKLGNRVLRNTGHADSGADGAALNQSGYHANPISSAQLVHTDHYA